MYDKLFDAFLLSKADKRHHGYTNTYAKLFEAIGEPDRLCEVGIKAGKSLWSWEQAFSDCNIYGIDISKKGDLEPIRPNLYERKRIHVLWECDSANVDQQYRMEKFLGFPVDVIIDDGAHDVQAQIGTFLNLRGMAEKAYVVEDVLGEFNLGILKAVATEIGYEYYIQSSTKPLEGNAKDQYIMVLYKKGSEASKINV